MTVGGSTVWDAGNDGDGSGLSADMLDGFHQTSFQRDTRLAAVVNDTTSPFAGITGSVISAVFATSGAITSVNSRVLQINIGGNWITVEAL